MNMTNVSLSSDNTTTTTTLQTTTLQTTTLQTTTLQTTTLQTKTEDNSSTDINLIIGVSVGCGSGLILIILIVLICIKLKLRKKRNNVTRKPPGISEIEVPNPPKVSKGCSNISDKKKNDPRNSCASSNSEYDFFDFDSIKDEYDDYENNDAIMAYHSQNNVAKTNASHDVPPPIPPKDYH